MIVIQINILCIQKLFHIEISYFGMGKETCTYRFTILLVDEGAARLTLGIPADLPKSNIHPQRRTGTTGPR